MLHPVVDGSAMLHTVIFTAASTVAAIPRTSGLIGWRWNRRRSDTAPPWLFSRRVPEPAEKPLAA